MILSRIEVIYNSFVQNRAKAGHTAISDSCGSLFKVMGSTEASDTDAAIYWLNGVQGGL